MALYCAAMMSETPPIVTRFAPSPTGYLHLGHLVNAIYVWGLSRALGGQVILRLEDHDRGRCRPEYEAAILDDLDWLGFQPDLGAPGEFRAGPTPWRQSDNAARYGEVLAGLAERGLLYTCTCSRKQILARTGDQPGELRYDGHCRAQDYRPDREGGTRLLLESGAVDFRDLCLGPQRQDPAIQCGDLLLRDRHGCWTYQFAVAVDDWDQGVNLVIRGEDLLDSTGRQLRLARLLGRRDGPHFLHHPLISDGAGRKLSKRDFDKGLGDYRAEGWPPARVLGEAAARVGLVPPGTDLAPEDVTGCFARGTMAEAVRSAVRERFAQHEEDESRG